MRNYLILMSATALAACGGSTGPVAVGGAAPPAGPGGTPTPTAHSFVNPTQDKTYQGVGAVHTFRYNTASNGLGQYSQLYQGDASTVRDGGITVAYSPRDAIFELTIDRSRGGLNTATLRFQDPAHRTDFGGQIEPQGGVPDIDGKGIQYLQTGSASGIPLAPGTPGFPSYSDIPFGADAFTSDGRTFFYQKPGTTTQYVTYAGYVRNQVSVVGYEATETAAAYLENRYTLERAAFAYGERTANGAVPRSGSASFSGDMLATMIFNPDFDSNPGANTYFQWIAGTATHQVDFGTLGVSSSFSGTVGDPARDAYTNGQFSMPGGSTFTAAAQSAIDLVAKGGFFGQFSSASFRRPDGSNFTLNIAGSSIDGAFFGPSAQEIGGGFRVVGGTPDERIDILGAFTGKK